MASDYGRLRVPWNQHRFGEPFLQPFPSLSRPRCIGCCSFSSQKYINDARNLSYLYGPPFPNLPLDLNAGIDSVIRKTPGHVEKDLEIMLRYIEHHKAELLRPISRSQPETLGIRAHFVTLRGILRQIMCLQYDRCCMFRIKATLLNGTIYLAKEETEQQRQKAENMTKRAWDMCSWGYKFEQYMTSDHPQSKPVTDVPVNEGDEFLAMFRSHLHGFDLLYGAEMDCVASKVPIDFEDPKCLDSLQFVELKTCVQEMSATQKRSFDHYKSANWWSQSFLVNIPTIYAGLRDDQGMVRDIQEYDVRQLARDKPWSPSAMAIFLVQFLNQLKALMELIDDPEAVVQVDFNAFDRVVNYNVLRGKQHQILPDWYRDILKG